jgi:lysophospholipase L1-like esterase
MYICALLTVGLAAAEVTARIEDRIRLGVPVLAAPDHDRDLVVHDELGIHGRPEGRYKKWRLNRYGFRGHEIAGRPADGCVRVVALGASETFGLYESPGGEFPARLESLLSQRQCVEVVNAGITGLSLPGVVTLWRNWASRFGAEVVIVYPTPAFYLATNPPRPPAQSPATAPVAPVVPTLRVIERLRDVVDIPAFIQRRRIEALLDEERRGHPDSWLFGEPPPERLEQFGDDLAELVTAIRRAGAAPILATHATAWSTSPSRADVDDIESLLQFSPRADARVLVEFERTANRAIVDLAHATATPVVDVASRMNGHREWFGDASHFNDAGAQVAAELIADGIRQAAASRIEMSALRTTNTGQAGAHALQ